MRAIRIRAAVLPCAGAPLELAELELAPPGPREALVRLHASGVCHSDLNAIDGTSETRCPAVLGHEGAGVVEAVGEGTRLRVGERVALSWAPACGHCEECLRDLGHLCATAWPAMALGGLMDGTSRLSRDGVPVFHYSFLSTFAQATVVPEASCVPLPADAPLDVAAIVGCAVTTGIGAVWNTAGVRPGERVAVLGCGGVGLSAVLGAVAVGAAPVIAVDVAEDKLAAALELGATDAVLWRGSAEETAQGVAEAAGGRRGLRHRGHGPARGGGGGLPLHPGAGSGVLVGIPREGAILALPALSIPRRERRVLGSLYGSARPARDFRLILDLHGRGRLPLERLVSHRMALEEVGEAFALMQAGKTRRAVLDVAGNGGRS